jgi:hypothetical protein
MAGRHQEAISSGIIQIRGIPPKLVEVDRGQYISNTQPLADVSLSGSTGHYQHMAAHVSRVLLQHFDIGLRRWVVQNFGVHGQSLSILSLI